MKPDGPPLKLKQSKCLEVTNAIRHEILSGRFKPGELLPPMHDLAAEFQTSFFTIQTALSPLEEQGMVERKRGVGTRVLHHADVLTTAAIYCGDILLGFGANTFRGQIAGQLQTQLADAGIHAEFFIDSRTDAQRYEPFPALVEAVEVARVQALLVVGCDYRNVPWLHQLPVASSFVTTADIPNRVGSDAREMLFSAAQQLARRGCEHVGLISSIQNSPHDTREAQEQCFYAAFLDSLAHAGLKLCNSFVHVPETWCPKIEAYGYDHFKAMWQQDKRPDGVMVYPDVAARGAMAAALEMGVRVGQEPHLVFHRNAGVDWFCPLSVDWVESDTTLWAAQMIRQIRQQKAGQTVSPIEIGTTLVTHLNDPMP